MSLLYGIKAISQAAGAAKPHILGFATARTGTDSMLEVWNDATGTAVPFKVNPAGVVVLGTIVMSTANSRLVPGATGFTIRDNANANSNLVVTDAGGVTVRNGLTVTAGTTALGANVTVGGGLIFSTAETVIVPGATSISLRNNANNADNLIITNAGAATFRSTVGGITTLTATTVIVGTGSAPTPSIAFSSETDTGIFADGAENWSVAVKGDRKIAVAPSIALTIYPGPTANNSPLVIVLSGSPTTLNVPTIDAYAEWNAAGVAFDGIRYTVTNTASAAGARLLNLFVGASSVFAVNVSGSVFISATKVLGARVTGYTAMTGSPDKATAYATGSVTLPQLAGRVAQLQADLTTHGLIGA